jgi:hypothetical protein
MLKLRLINSTWQRSLLLTSAATHYAQRLGWNRRKRPIRLAVKLVPGLRESPKWRCRGVAFQDNPDHYTIFLEKRLSPDWLARVLAHEMVHVDQWVTGRMQDLDDDRQRVKWGKRFYYPHRLAYSRHPWERNAERREPRLFKSFKRYWASSQTFTS